MEIFAFTSLFFIAVYITYYFFIINGIAKLKEEEFTENLNSELFLSIIIPFRNEEESIVKLITDFQKQSYSKEKFEVILVNDHSTDKSKELAEKAITQSENFKVKSLYLAKGKKAALKLGFGLAKGDYIITIDADCRVSGDYLKSQVLQIEDTDADLILGPVKLEKGKGFLYRFQLLEHLALQATTIGSCGLNNPILSNGANLVFKKKMIGKTEDLLKENYASGDDIFLLQHIKKTKDSKIVFNRCKDAIVITKSQETWNGLFMQHIRWISKSKGYKDLSMILSAMLIGLGNIGLLSLLVLFLVDFSIAKYLVLGVLLKTFADMLLLFSVIRFYEVKVRFLGVLFNEFIYSFFSLFVAFSSVFIKPKWKGRAI